MEKKTTKSQTKKEVTPQVTTTGIEEPALSKVSVLIISQTRGFERSNGHSIFADENYAKAEMQKDIEKFKQAYLPGTYEIVKEEEYEVIININSIQLQWTLLRNCPVEIEGKTYLTTPNRYNQYNTCKMKNK